MITPGQGYPGAARAALAVTGSKETPSWHPDPPETALAATQNPAGPP